VRGSIVHVVDDDEEARKGTARLLDAAGFEARTYTTAGEFLGSIGSELSGCIILDVRLADHNGSSCRPRWQRAPCRCRLSL
jgi:two-component system response regulator FixJ